MNTRLTPNRRTRLTFAGVIATLAASLALIISGMSGGHIPDTEAHAVTTTVKTTKQKQKRANKANRTVAKRVRKAKAQARKAERKAQLKQRNLYIAMRDLWYQHMEWTYATVTAFVSDSPGLEPTMNRLLKNQDDIGNAIKPFYGKQAGNQLTALLREHIEMAVPVLVAARDGDDNALDTAVTDWYRNAKQVGEFLESANPAWKDGQEMLEEHITGTIAYAVDQLQGDYARSIVDYEAAEHHMLMLANELSAGIIKAFPKRFR